MPRSNQISNYLPLTFETVFRRRRREARRANEERPNINQNTESYRNEINTNLRRVANAFNDSNRGLPGMNALVNQLRNSTGVLINRPATPVETNNRAIILLKRFTNATELWNVDCDYCVEILKELAEECPPMLFVISQERMMKVKQCHIQYWQIVEEVVGAALQKMQEWIPIGADRRKAVKLCLQKMTQICVDLQRANFDDLSCYDRSFYGIFNRYQFDEIKHQCDELVETLTEANINYLNYPLSTASISQWILNNQVLNGPFFKIFAFTLAVVDWDYEVLINSREKLKAVKEEKERENWERMIPNDETTELSAVEAIPPKEIEEELPVFITPEESQKVIDELFAIGEYNRRNKKI